MTVSKPKPWQQFRLRTLLLAITLIALAILPIRYFLKNRWRFQHYQQPDIVRQRSVQWLRENPPPTNSGVTMLSQESDLPSP